MKKIVIVFVVAALIVITTILWISGKGTESGFLEFVQYGIVLTIVVFALFLGFKRFKSYREREPREDELSKRIVQKAASLSYYVSIYLWLAIMYFSDRIKYETHSIIGAGILGMAVTFGICWLITYIRGIRNE
jgi:peptidoglycan/LPS O-acetylase OafA/YrhL